MLVLVTADNLLQMFVGWEGVGLCSYLLINFWYGRLQANKAAVKAMIVNRVGDFGLAIAIFASYFFFQTLDYGTLFALAPGFSDEVLPFLGGSVRVLDFIGFFIFVGAVGKSAQLGLHTWLPDAMEGPTPVSALIHAATMVTAGVFLICRCSPLLQFAPNISSVITIVGGMTAFMAATTGLLQNDLKRVIAYSTCSQLGYMVFAAGLSGYSVSIFHLSNHAFFKALLFLGAGSVIHAMSDEQDMRRMGGLVKILPFTYTTMVIGSLALMGFPFLTGFYSKDVILEVAYGSFVVEGRFVHALGSLAAFFTAYYSVRLLSLTFLRPANGYKPSFEHAHESPIRMSAPLFLLSLGSVFIGYLSRDMMIGLGTDFWGNALFAMPNKQNILRSEWLDASIKAIPLIFSLSGALLALHNYVFFFEWLFKAKQTQLGRALYTFFNRK
jgi:NADH-ubiquinone oxidoreductase chain 5